ncbi:glycerophosphodiester phosphodiesterase [Halorussus halobius]|uniref:glycerophosphodiester phosphodiesterase n=1 Tax=Halorussus halobius TaxID=1710537 RepID=UPI00109224DB|nr:glycerophosphodiester phosphodiesterase family protein [Halorussus halobius]
MSLPDDSGDGGLESRGDDRPAILAHRGFAGAAPENTVAAARRAAAGPGRAAMVEVDAMPTGDGTVVCFHDDRLHAEGGSRGLTDARGTVWETPDDVVLDAEVLDSGQTVPRLADVFGALSDDVGVNVELKNPGSHDLRLAEPLDPAELADRRTLWDSFVGDVLAVLDDHDNDVLVSSFYEAALAATREADPSVPVGVLAWDALDDALEIAARYDAEAVHPPVNLVAGTPFAGEPGHLDASPDVTTDVVARAHDAGRAVNVWTVSTWYQAAQLRRAGVDGLLVDYPCLLAADDRT